MFSVAGVVLVRSLRDVRPAEVWAHLDALGALPVGLAIGMTVVSYLVLTLYDSLALFHVRYPMRWCHSAPTSFNAFAIGHSVGFTALSGGAIRYRAYSMAGLDGRRIARIVVFCTATFFLGSSLLLGLVLASEPQALLHAMPLPTPVVFALIMLLIGCPLSYLVWSLLPNRNVSIGRWRIVPPAPAVVCAQLLLGVADMLIACFVLYCLMPVEAAPGFVTFLGVYLASLAISSFSNVPGGLGVFEGSMLLLLPDVGKAELVATLVAFRLIYFVLPLAVALVLFAWQVIDERRRARSRSS